MQEFDLHKIDIKINKINAILVSGRSCKSLGAKYTIFEDRLELSSCWGTFILPFDQIVDMWIWSGPVVCQYFMNTGRPKLFAFRLDFCDLFTHVAVSRKTGCVKEFHFMPNDPHLFLSKLAEAKSRFLTYKNLQHQK